MTFTAEVTQFSLPYGDKRTITTELPMEAQSFYMDMLRSGCRIEAEVLRTREVSMTISDPVEEVDIDFSITPNGPEVNAGLIEMLKREQWKTDYKHD